MTKICTKCHKEYPATAEYFYRNSKGIDGLRCECKQCQQRHYAKYYEDKHREERENKTKIEADLKQRNAKICSKCGKEYPNTSDYFHNRKDTKDGLSFWCKSCALKNAAKYRNVEHDIIMQRTREQNERRRQDPEYLKQRAEYDKQYYQKHKEKKAKYNHERYLSLDKDKVREYQRKWRAQNIEHIKERDKRYREQNTNKLKEYDKKRYNENKLNRLFSNAICRSLKGAKSERHWEDLVPYNLEQLKAHIEAQFVPPMSWDNYGTYWEIDHIIPQNLFDFSSSEDHDFQVCWSLINLRPLEKSLNRSRPKDGSDIPNDLKYRILNQ